MGIINLWRLILQIYAIALAITRIGSYIPCSRAEMLEINVAGWSSPVARQAHNLK